MNQKEKITNTDDKHKIKPKIIGLFVLYCINYEIEFQKQMSFDENTSLNTFVEVCYENLRNTNYKKSEIQFIGINGKKYEETYKRSLKDIGLKEKSQINLYIELKPQKICVNVFFKDQYESKKQMVMLVNLKISINQFIQSCYEKLIKQFFIINSMTGKTGKIQYMLINGKQYRENDDRQLKEIGIKDETEIVLIMDFKPNRICLNVIFANTQNEPIKIQLHVDDNTSLSKFVESCYEKSKSQTFIQYIFVNGQKFQEQDERSLKELGLKDLSEIILPRSKMIEDKESLIKQYQKSLNEEIGFQDQQEIDLPIQINDQESLINNYSNIVFSHLNAAQQTQVVELEKQILLQTLAYNEENQNLKQDQNFHLNKYHIIDNAFRRNLDEIKRSDNLIDPLKKINQQIIQQDNQQFNQDFLIFLLATQLKEQGQMVYQTKQDDQLNMLSLQASFGFGLDETSCQQLKIKSKKVISFQQLSDQQELNEFNNNIKNDLAKQFGVPKENIHLLKIEEGSIKLYFIITNAAGVKEKVKWKKDICKIYEKYGDAELILHKYFQVIHLSAHDFDPRYNIEWGIDHKEYELRGPKHDQLKYFFARGWKGYALNVKGKYNNGNDDWLQMDGNKNEWHIMFHGTKQGCVKDILEQGLKPGLGQVYEFQTDIRRKTRVGVGVYFSNHIEVVEAYSDPIQIHGFSYKVVFKSRVNPKKLKQIQKPSCIDKKKGNPDWDNDYFVVNRTEDIRPYRILLKKE